MTLIAYLFYEQAVEHVLQLVARLRTQLSVSEIVLIYNRRNLNSSVIALNDSSIRLVPYAGSDWEFGAYQLGLSEAAWRGGRGVIFLNDTAGRNYPFSRSDRCRFVAACQAASAGSEPAVVGKIESTGCTYKLMGRDFNRWVRSNLFYLNAAALEALGGTLFDSAIFHAPRWHGECLDVGVPMSKELEDYLRCWLSPEAGGAGWLAHTQQTGIDAGILRGKLGSILLEKHLAARLLASGAKLVQYEPDGPSPLHRFAVWLFFKRRGLQRRFGL